MTIDRLAQMTQDEFSAIRRELATNFATKDDLKKSMMAVLEAMDDKLERYATKDDLQKSTITILQAIDTVIMRFDKMEKDSAADKLLHDRHETSLENHEVRIKTLEKIKN